MTPTDLDLGLLAERALAIRRRMLRHPAQVSYDSSIWPGWWPEETALRAIGYLRDAGVDDDAVEAGLLLVGCGFMDDDTDEQIANLGGPVVMSVKAIQGRPSDYPASYWRSLDHDAFAEHRLARAALHIALMDAATDWNFGSKRRRRVQGDATHRILPMLGQMRHEGARRIAQEVMLRTAILGPPVAIK